MPAPRLRLGSGGGVASIGCDPMPSMPHRLASSNFFIGEFLGQHADDGDGQFGSSGGADRRRQRADSARGESVCYESSSGDRQVCMSRALLRVIDGEDTRESV